MIIAEKRGKKNRVKRAVPESPKRLRNRVGNRKNGFGNRGRKREEKSSPRKKQNNNTGREKEERRTKHGEKSDQVIFREGSLEGGVSWGKEPSSCPCLTYRVRS